MVTLSYQYGGTYNPNGVGVMYLIERFRFDYRYHYNQSDEFGISD
jgi:hypothetical protein